MRLVLALVLCAGCFDFTGDGAGDSLSFGSGGQSLTFAGAQVVLGEFPPGVDSDHANVATGGTDLIALASDGAPFTRPFDATVDDAAAITIAAVDGASVTLLGGAGTAELDITDPETGVLFDRYAYAASAIASAAVVPTAAVISSPDVLTSTAAAFAFWPGDLEVGIALENSGGANRLVDTSLVLTLAGATQLDWQTLSVPGATPGTYAVAVGDTGIAAQLAVVDHVDTLALLIAFGGVACFAADTDGAFVVGVPWSFTVDGAPVPGMSGLASCVAASSGDHVTASAGGLSLDTNIAQ